MVSGNIQEKYYHKPGGPLKECNVSAQTLNFTPSNSSADRARRRQLRYSKAEEALTVSFQTHIRTTSTPTLSTADSSAPLQIQLRLLHQAAEFLTTQAAEARERSSVLSNDVLKDRANVDPDRYSQALVERWKEERRLQKIEEEARRLETVIASVTNADSPPATILDSIMEPRAQKNLIKFLQTSGHVPTRTRIRSRMRNSAPSIDRSPRRMTMADVSPFRARPCSVTEAFMDSVQGHARAKSGSAAGILASPTTTASYKHRRKPTLALCSPSLGSVAEDGSVLRESTEEDITPSTAMTSVFSHRESIEVETPTTEIEGPTTPRLSGSSIPSSAAKSTNGTATIFQYSYLHSNPTKIEVEVEIPAYAQDLFAGFESSTQDGALDLSLPSGLTAAAPTWTAANASTSGFFETSSQVRKRLQRASLPASHSPSPTRPSTSLPTTPNLKPRASLSSLHLNSNGKTPRERKWGSLLSIPESSSGNRDRSPAPGLVSLSLSTESSRTSLVPPLSENDAAASTRTLCASSDPSAEESNIAAQENGSGAKARRTLKHKLSSRLSMVMFGSPTKMKRRGD
ncbi:hypothetical protein BT96DRAFT_981060 [Gymnopus androsaceus JB14]|uniref:Uncharacterized protein n=1 Tax=Gymnopus androsaceus JB14 TaxID=1447944 RepID=A0A6A4GTA9_9AGAR|nr:hypothetical protein BT96DRAFT_981060 [Gymnopus androsaceus JB14]